MSKKNNKLDDSNITQLLGIPSATVRDWKKTSSDNWRKKLYLFLKSHTYNELLLRRDMILPFLQDDNK